MPPAAAHPQDRRQNDSLREQLTANTQAIAELTSKVDTIYGVINAAEGAFKTLEFLGRVIKPLIIVSASAAAIYQLFTPHK